MCTMNSRCYQIHRSDILESNYPFPFCDLKAFLHNWNTHSSKITQWHFSFSNRISTAAGPSTYTFFHFLLSRQEYAKGISFITIKHRHYESKAFCKVKSDNLAREWSTEVWILFEAYSNLYGSLSQFKFEIHNTTTLFESRFQEYEKVYYKS